MRNNTTHNEAEVVDDLDDLRATAFQKAVEMLSGQVAAIPGGRGPALLRTGKPQPIVGGDESLIAKIARKLAISADAIAEIYSDGAAGERWTSIGRDRD